MAYREERSTKYGWTNLYYNDPGGEECRLGVWSDGELSVELGASEYNLIPADVVARAVELLAEYATQKS